MNQKKFILIFALFIILSGEVLSLPIDLETSRNSQSTLKEKLSHAGFRNFISLIKNNRLENGIWNAHIPDEKKVLLQKTPPGVLKEEVAFLITANNISTTTALEEIEDCNASSCSYLGKSRIHRDHHHKHKKQTSNESLW